MSVTCAKKFSLVEKEMYELDNITNERFVYS